MRTASLAGCCMMVVGLGVGCDRGGADLAPIEAESATLKKDESSLFEARGALQRERKQLSEQRTELAEKRKVIAPADRDTQAALADQEVQLAKKETDLVKQESDLSRKLDTLLSQRAELIQKVTAQVPAAAPAGAEERATRREESAARREKEVAERELKVAEREQTLAQREATLARREKETCGVAPAAAAVVMPKLELPKGLRYSQHDVEPVYKRALKSMQDRGLLSADLPSGGKLIETTRTAMQEGDYVRAKYAADQLLEEIEAVKMDRAFIAGKMARLSSVMKKGPSEGEARKQVEALFQEATAAYGDGKFAVANQKINRLFSLVK